MQNLRYHRLVITFGKSGSGKATLAVESARWLGKRQGGYYDATLHGKCAPGGVFFVDIHAAVASADALGIAPYEAISLAILRAIFPGYMPKSPFASAYAAVMQVADELRKLHCILVLARFEGRSVDDYLSWLLDTLLLRCPGLRLLVSRQRPLEGALTHALCCLIALFQSPAAPLCVSTLADAVSLVAPVQLPVPALDEEDAARLFWQLQPQVRYMKAETGERR